MGGCVQESWAGASAKIRALCGGDGGAGHARRVSGRGTACVRTRGGQRRMDRASSGVVVCFGAREGGRGQACARRRIGEAGAGNGRRNARGFVLLFRVRVQQRNARAGLRLPDRGGSSQKKEGLARRLLRGGQAGRRRAGEKKRKGITKGGRAGWLLLLLQQGETIRRAGGERRKKSLCPLSKRVRARRRAIASVKLWRGGAEGRGKRAEGAGNTQHAWGEE